MRPDQATARRLRKQDPAAGQREALLSPQALKQAIETEDFALGHAALDGEHRALVEGLLDLWLAQARGAADAALFQRITEIVRLEKEHFRNEEAVMAARGVPGLKDHRHAHNEIIRDMDTYAREVRGGLIEAPLFIRIASSRLFNHLVDYDLSCKPFIGNADSRGFDTKGQEKNEWHEQDRHW